MTLRSLIRSQPDPLRRRAAGAAPALVAPKRNERGPRSLDPQPSTLNHSAFSLLEVMIACGIFFMATFAILALVSQTLRNARALGRGEVDAGMAAAQVYQFAKTNKQAEFSGSGDFGEAYPDFSFEFASQEYMTNGLLQIDIVVRRRGARNPVDSTSIWVYSPDAKAGFGPR